MYRMNVVEEKTVEFYQSGDIQKAINYNKLTGYSKPILVDMQMQNEWLDTKTLCELCGLDVGKIYNKSMPWLFFIHNSEFKVMPLAPLVHSISFADLANHGLTEIIKIPSMKNDIYTSQFVKNHIIKHINVNGNLFQVTLLHGKRAKSNFEQYDLYSYILSNRISSYIDDIDFHENFEYDLMEEYRENRVYDDVMCNSETMPLYFEIEPRALMIWHITNPIHAHSRYTANGNKMAWLPVLRFRGKI